MELTPRKQAVLKAIVKAYIETGEPIGSKNLVALLENAPSSATLRNEMSELCELGLLKQPHTSAGRVPTGKGYKLYINKLMPKPQISDHEAAIISDAIEEIHCEPENIPAKAAQALSALTGLPAVSCLITKKPTGIKKIQLLPIGRSSVMLLVITDDGRTRSRIFRKSGGISPEVTELFDSLVKEHIKGKHISELTKPYIQSVTAKAGLYSLEVMPLLSAVLETACEIDEAFVSLKGENTLYNICASENDARKVMSLINRRDPIISILEGIGDGVGTVFGADTGYTELKGEVVVAAAFSAGDNYRGYVGVIGPNRMSYERIIPCIEYTAERLTKIMTEAQKDMED